MTNESVSGVAKAWRNISVNVMKSDSIAVKTAAASKQ